MLSILHISDLHRSQDEPMDNKSLLAYLVADRDRYLGEFPKIPPPEAIVVSGDLIEGALVGEANWEKSIREQYEIAHSFLSDLCERFLDGDKSRIILTPGNHDVCWNTSYRAMQGVTSKKYPDDVYATLVKPNSTYRWSWSARKLFQIVDQTIYEQRMDSYWKFVDSFYNGVTLRVPIDRSRGFQLFELCQRRILVAAFDSIDGTDCFNYVGSIARDAVGKCAIELRDARHSYDLQIAVWHHSIQGPPVRSDYMDASQVQELNGHGFQLGLHGHQHVASTLSQHIHLDESRSMAVVSAGSLCAGTTQLPRGVNRQYNLVVVEDGFLGARVHVREMGEGNQFTRKRTGAFFNGFVEVCWKPPRNIAGMRSDAQECNVRRAVEDAETALRTGKACEAVETLRNLDISSQPYARKLQIDALLSEGHWGELVNAIGVPVTVEEAVLLVSALIQTGQFDDAQRRLDEAREVDSVARRDLQDRLETKRMMRQS